MLKMMVAFFRDFFRFRAEIGKHDIWIKKFAAKKGYSLNPSWMFYTNLKIWLAETMLIFGKRYCPCFEPSGDGEKDRALLCPCKFLDAEIERDGMCHCKLFGRGDLSSAEWKKGMGHLMAEYRVSLKVSGNILDTRGMTVDPLRGLPIPDAYHQVKQALQQIPGKEIVVLVASEQEKINMEKFSVFREFICRSEKSGDHYRIIINR